MPQEERVWKHTLFSFLLSYNGFLVIGYSINEAHYNKIKL